MVYMYTGIVYICVCVCVYTHLCVCEYCCSVTKLCLTLCNPIKHARLSCPSLSTRVCSNSCPLSW